jgi:hypothetical protein
LEAIVDAVLYGLQDRWNSSLTPSQRVGRMLVVGIESLLVEGGSQIAGIGGLLIGGKPGEVGAQYIFSSYMSENVVPTTTYMLFDWLNLGVPNDISPMK